MPPQRCRLQQLAEAPVHALDAPSEINNRVHRHQKGLKEGVIRNLQTKSGFGVWGGLEAISTLNVNQWVAQQLRRQILLHIGLVTFNFHFPKIKNSSFS